MQAQQSGRRKVEPGIWKTAASTYMVRYYTPDGREKAQNFARLTDARNFKAEVRIKKQRGEYTNPALSKIRYEEFANKYIQGKLGLSRRTRDRYNDILRVHLIPAFGRAPLRTITPDDVQLWITELTTCEYLPGKTYAPETIRGIYSLFQAIMSHAVDRSLLAKSPCRGIELPPRIWKEQRFLSEDEAEKLIQPFSHCYKALIYLATYVGLRWQEVTALRPHHVQMKPGEMASVRINSAIERSNGQSLCKDVGKTRAAHRTLKLPDFLREALSRHLRDYANETWVFPAPEGGLLLYDNFSSRTWQPAVREAGLVPLTFHQLRHTAAAFMIDDGADPLQIKRRMGHEDIRTTLNLYGHLFPDKEEELVGALDQRYHTARERHADYLRTHSGNVVTALPRVGLPEQDLC